MLQAQHVHIIAFDVPSPPDYGGVIEVYYKIESLVKAGIKVHLHSFIYGRQVSKRLAEMCEQVHYYPRKLNPLKLLDSKPFIVVTRSDESLLRNLVKDDYPIIFEGLHTCFFLAHPMLRERKKVVRLHNIEHEYYNGLAALEQRRLKKWYFNREAKRLDFFERVLDFADIIACISEGDFSNYRQLFGSKVHYLPCFHGNKEIRTEVGTEKFLLYHGNLSINENVVSVDFLMTVFGNKTYKIVIAGKHPSKQLEKQLSIYPNFKLVKNPNNAEMSRLLKTAHIHLLPFQIQCGAKIKLVNALFNGKFIITNSKGYDNTLNTISYANTEKEWLEVANRMYGMEFSTQDMEDKTAFLNKTFNNELNIQKLIALCS